MAPEELRQTNPDLILGSIMLVAMPLFAWGSVAYSISRSGGEMLRRPSMDRNGFNWSFDPLQSLFISTCVMAGIVVGSACRLPIIGMSGFWTAATYCCLLVGLLVGQWLVYKVYRRKISAETGVSHPPCAQKRIAGLSRKLILWSVVLFAVAVAFVSKPSFVMRSGSRVTVITRQDNPVVYWGTEGAIIFVAASLSAFGVYRARKEND